MDRQRRRYIPTSEDLEARKLLSTTSSTVFGSTSNRNSSDLAINFQQKQQRVERLPHYLLALQPGRFLPKETTSEIQAGLTQLMGEMQKPPTSALNTFNLTLRKIVPNVSFSQGDARKLNKAFVLVLQAAKAPQGAIDQLSASLNQLATQVDTASIQPVFLATNDYTLVLQTALAVGKPLPAPSVPQIAVNKGIQVNRTHIKTPESRPQLTGTYEQGVTMQIVNQQGAVLGQANTNNSGQYRVRITDPLPPGTYTFYARAEDQGHLSLPSHTFDVKILPPKNKG